MLQPPSKNDRQRSINDFGPCTLDDQTAMQWRWPLIVQSAACIGQDTNDEIKTVLSLYVLVFNFTNMHAMSYRSEFFLARSSKVNICKPAFYLTIMYPLTITQIKLPRGQCCTMMSHTKSLNTLLLEVMISSTNEGVCIHDLGDHALQMMFNAWWASMNVGSKWLIASNNSRSEPSWRFYLHCGIEETGSPSIICIVSYQILRHPSEHQTSWMGTHCLATGHIAKLN
jgi:hypothetical protein